MAAGQRDSLDPCGCRGWQLIVETPYTRRTAARLGRLADSSSNAQEVADGVAAVLREMDASLSSIIGRQSFLALLNRGIGLTDATHQWLDLRQEAVDVETALSALRLALARHGASEAAACGAALVATLHGSLAVLIGHSLAERLLQSVGRTPQDDFL